MITPLVAQLIAEERIAAGIRAAETTRLVALTRGERTATRGRRRHLLSSRLALPGLHRRQAPVVQCATC